MRKVISNSQLIKEQRFFLTIFYQAKVKKSYFIYFILFLLLSFLVYISSFFIIINLAINNKYQISKNINDINIFVTPIINLLLITSALFLLLIAPQRIHRSSKQSSIMFYFSFWMLVISTLLNSKLQFDNIDIFLTSNYYNWLNITFKITILVSFFSLFFIQIFFWIMRRKFTLMPTDYEIYEKQNKQKQDKKAIKLQKKLNLKVKKSQFKPKEKLLHEVQKEVKNEK